MNERIFVVSDFHGMKNIYDIITNYLDEVALCNPEDNIKLIINGDIIDRGDNSIQILQDVMERMDNQKGYFSIEPLAGNHELMMYEAMQLGYNSYWAYRNLDWYYSQNGGIKTATDFSKLDKNEQEQIISYLDKLEIQKSFEQEMLNTKGVIVAHAHASGLIKFLADDFHIKTKLEDIKEDIVDYYKNYQGMSDKQREIMTTVWDRATCGERMGLSDYTTIIGHTPSLTKEGYEYNEFHKVLDIDGGCARLAVNYVDEITVPLVELDFNNKRLIINRFSSNGEQLNTHIITKDGIYKENNKVLKI